MNKYIKSGLPFGLHMFYYACLELLINDLAVGAVGAESVVALYGLISVMVATGFLLFPLSRRFFKDVGLRKLSLIVAWALNLVAFIVILSSPAPALFSLAAMAATLTAGYIGGFVFYSIATGPVDKTCYGRLFGITGASAFLIQYDYTKLIALLGESGFLFNAVILGAVISVCAAWLLFSHGQLLFQAIQKNDQRKPAPAQQKNMGKYLWGVFFIIAVIWAMEGILDGVVTGLHAGQVLNVSEFPRLFHAAGLIIAGFVFDWKNGRWYAPITMLFMIAQVIVVFLFMGAEGFNIALSAMYLCGAFGSVYATAALTLSATSSSSPALWAVMGRVAKYIPNGIMSVVGGYFYTTNTNTTFSLVYIVLLGVLFILFFAQGKLSVQRVTPAAELLSVPDMPTLEELTAGYGITNREMEVLQLLIVGKTTSEIAEDMIITEKSVQNYVSSMLSKTGSKSRGNMIARFTGRAGSDNMPAPGR